MEQLSVPRRKWYALGVVLAMIATGMTAMAVWPAKSADAAIAGVTQILKRSDQILDQSDASGSCPKDLDYCISYPLTLDSGTIIQAQVDNPTSGVWLGLYDDFDTDVTDAYIGKNDSGWINAAIESDGESQLQMDYVSHPGNYKLIVGSDDQQHFSVFALEIPDSLKLVNGAAHVKGEFDNHTTRQISGKYTNYWDGVVFNGKKGTPFSAHFHKPGDGGPVITLYDDHHNELVREGGNDSATIEDFVLTYTGLYELVIEGETQGHFTLDLGATYVRDPNRCDPYPDVNKDNPHCKNIKWLRGQGITKPADGRYHPTSPVTRGSMTAFLFRLTHPGKSSPKCTRKPFPDVSTNNTFCGYIQWAVKDGVAKGYPNGTFGPNKPVTRGAMAAFMQRIAAGHPAPKCTKKPFKDVAKNSTFCKPITWMKKNKITFGVGGGKYGTTQTVNRQSMASFMHRIHDYMH